MAAEVCTQGLDTGFVSLGYAKVAVLGVVQGITELLPISSTAHMRIVPALLGWRDPGSAFSAAMQLAALAAVIGFFWADVRDIARGSVSRGPAPRLEGLVLSLCRLGGACDHPDPDWRPAAQADPQPVRLTSAHAAGDRHLLRHDGGPARDRGRLLPLRPAVPAGDARRRHDRRRRAGRRADPRRVALGLNAHRSVLPRPQARGCRALFVPARHSRHRGRGAEGAAGNSGRRSCRWRAG